MTTEPRLGLFVCPRCGKFRYSEEAELFFNQFQGPNETYKLSQFFRNVSERAYGKRDNSFFPVYGYEDLEKLLGSRSPSVQEKLDLLMRFLAHTSEFPGANVQFDADYDYPVLAARNSDEALFCLQTLKDQGLIDAASTSFEKERCSLTAAGWQHLQQIEQSGSDSANVFIAMWFDPTQDTAKSAIMNAITASGYIPVRIDEVEHVNRIDDEIIARIRQSKFLIADFTGQRNGVYFEAGFMLGLGRPVIWLCHESYMGQVHFDTRQYNTIVYSDLAELARKLQFRIEALLGSGPMKA